MYIQLYNIEIHCPITTDTIIYGYFLMKMYAFQGEMHNRCDRTRYPNIDIIYI